MKVKSLEAIPTIKVSDEAIARHMAEKAFELDINTRLRGKPLSRGEITQGLWHALAKRGATRLYNKIVAQPLFQAALW